MEGLAEGLHQVYLEEAPPLIGDPVAARDDYARVLTEEPEAAASFVQSRAPRELSPQEQTRAAELLEMERNALRLFTSCGWFFDDLAGIEPLQVLRYGARAMELAGPRGESLREEFLGRLAKARTNEEPPRDGRTLYLQEVEPTVPVHLAVGAGAAALEAVGRKGESVLADRPGADIVPGYRTTIPDLGRVQVVHRRTGRTWNLGYEVLWPEAGRIEVRIWQEGQEAEDMFFGTRDLPETFRDLVREGLQRDILARWAPELLVADHAERSGGFPALASKVLVGAVQALDRDQGDDALARVGDLAHLLTLLGLPIPFDAQTDFFHILQASSPEEQRRLEGLREPLGFVLPS
jgi:hypothetical protein